MSDTDAAMEVKVAEGGGTDGHKVKEEASPRHKSRNRLHQGEIIEGKREKKVVQRLDVQMGKPKEKLKIESGKGDKLGDIARVNHLIGKLKAPQLKPLHKVLFDRPGAMASMRKHLRLFNGFTFEVDSDVYVKKRDKLMKFTNVQLRSICQILDLERSGKREVLADRIMGFLMCPTNTGKPVITKKKKKKRTSTKDTKREMKSKPQTKKPTVESKSKAIVTDSSSDDDDDDDEEESKPANKEAVKSVSGADKPEQKDGDSDSSDEDLDDEDDDDEDEDEDEEKETSKSKTKQKPSARKKAAPKKTVKKRSAEESDHSASSGDDSDEERDEADMKKAKKPAARKRPAAKPVPKTKKADSSSNRGKKPVSKRKEMDDSSSDDEPLIKMIKKPPTNEHLEEAVKELLKDANLEVVTMKQICQRVYDKYPDFDLTSRKVFIKETVKGLIS